MMQSEITTTIILLHVSILLSSHMQTSSHQEHLKIQIKVVETYNVTPQMILINSIGSVGAG